MQMEKREVCSFGGKRRRIGSQYVKGPAKKETLFLPVADGSKKGKNKK